MKQTDVSIRKALPEDAYLLVTLRYQLLQEFEEPPVSLNEFMTQSLSIFTTFLQTDVWHTWVAQQDDQLIGTIWLQKVNKIPSFTEPSGCWGYVTNMLVIPAWRNQGIGTQLLNAVKEYAKAHHYELLVVWPSHASTNFYQRAGFKTNDQLYELKYTL